MKMNSFKTLFILSVLYSAWSHADFSDDYHVCQHDEQEFNPETADVEFENLPQQVTEGRLLQENAYPNLKIYPYYESLTQGTPEFITYIKTELVPPVLNLLQLAIRMKYPTKGKLQLNQTSICGMTTPDVLKSGVDADFFMFFTADTAKSTSWVATASYCVVSSGVNRPLTAKLLLNGYSIKPTTVTADPLRHEFNMYVIMHETLHALGFSSNFFNSFVDSSGTKLKNHVKKVSLNGSTRTVVDLPVLTDKLRKFYGCPDLEGAFMENNGGSGTAGSHWERRHFPFDLLSSGAIHGRRLSEFTLAFMEGTGWYAPDYDYAEPYFYGQGQGCNFVRQACDTTVRQFEEFCKGTGRGCSHTGFGGGFCKHDTCTDGCRFYTPQKEYLCEHPSGKSYTTYGSKQVYGRGMESKCFEGNLTSLSKTSASLTTYCFQYNCVGSGLNTQLEVKFGTTTLTCQKQGLMAVAGYNGGINCPDPLTFCNTVGKKYCPRGCLGRGKCINNKCVCNPGFQGVDCGFLA